MFSRELPQDLKDIYFNSEFPLSEIDDAWVLVHEDKNGNLSYVNQDGGEPEDQILVRDFSWVPELLNELESKIHVLEDEVDRLNITIKFMEGIS